MRSRKLYLVLIVMALMALVLSGCATKATGGGWIPSAYEEGEKATFGFVAMLDLPKEQENDILPQMMTGLPAKGNLQIVDHGGDGFKFHASVEGIVQSMSEDMLTFNGVGLLDGEERHVTVNASDFDKDGLWDYIEVWVMGEYYNKGVLQGGNINIR